MSEYNFDNSSEGDWEDRNDLAWSEFDWERYLCDQEEVFHRYLTYYSRYRNRLDRLDKVASQMGWDSTEWASAPPPGESQETGENLFSPIDEIFEEEESEDPLDPYTLYRHPIFIATKSLYIKLYQGWEHVVSHPANRIHSGLLHSYQKSLHCGEMNAVFAIHALDMGDYSLCVAQLKRALSDLNRSIRFLEEATRLRTYSMTQYHRDSVELLFDLREIWLRVINYCREEVNRHYDEED